MIEYVTTVKRPVKYLRKSFSPILVLMKVSSSFGNIPVLVQVIIFPNSIVIEVTISKISYSIFDGTAKTNVEAIMPLKLASAEGAASSFLAFLQERQY